MGTSDGLLGRVPKLAGRLSRPSWSPIAREAWIGDGVTLYRHIRARRPDLVGILVTAFAGPDTAAAAVAAGIRRVLGKPVDFGQLLPLIGEVLGGAW